MEVRGHDGACQGQQVIYIFETGKNVRGKGKANPDGEKGSSDSPKSGGNSSSRKEIIDI